MQSGRGKRFAGVLGALAVVASVVGAAPFAGAPVAGADPEPTVVHFALQTQAAYPNSVAVGPDGNLWFTQWDSANSAEAIVRKTPGGAETVFPTPNEGPDDITAGPDGNVWFIAGVNVGRITPTGVISLFPIPDTSCSSGGIDAIVVGPDGNLWFSGRGSSIGRVTPTGAITMFPLPPGSGGCVATGITPGPDGNLWYTRGTYVGRMSVTGNATEFAVPGDTAANRHTITTGPDGNLWFTEANTQEQGGRTFTVNAGALDRITPNGVVVGAMALPPFPGALMSVEGIGTGPDGAVWATGNIIDNDDAFVARATPTGIDLLRIPAASFDTTQPALRSAPVPGPGGVWFADGFNNDLTRITLPSATVTNLTFPNNPALLGSGATITATVTAPVLGGAPDGTVQFEDSSSGPVGPPVQLNGGRAALPITALAPGNHLIWATYSGSASYSSSRSFEAFQDVQATTRLEAEPAIARLSTQAQIYAFTLTATLTRVDGQAVGLYGLDMVDSNGQLLCHATNSATTPEATCTVLLDPGALARLVLGGGYTAIFPGDYVRAPSRSAPAPLVSIAPV